MESFIGFQFGDYRNDNFGNIIQAGDKSIIYRVSDGMFEDELISKRTLQSNANGSQDGQIVNSVSSGPRIFNIHFAFDYITETGKKALFKWLNGKKVLPLIFDEEPYKVYDAKITGQPKIEFIPFNKSGFTIYKGKGEIEFTAYCPYAHTPNIDLYINPIVQYDSTSLNYLISTEENLLKIAKKEDIFPYITEPGDHVDLNLGARAYILGVSDPRCADHYSQSNKLEWIESSGLKKGNWVDGYNGGDLPAPFALIATPYLSIYKDDIIKIGENQIKFNQSCQFISWNSKVGIVKGIYQGAENVIDITGDLFGTIPVGENQIQFEHINSKGEPVISDNQTDIKLNYNFWYY